MSYMKNKAIERLNLEPPFAMSEEELLALEQQHDTMIAAAKRVRYHLTECEQGDAKTLSAFDELLKHFGMHDDVVESAGESAGIPEAEMAVHEGE